jgi:hypothetical protein
LPIAWRAPEAGDHGLEDLCARTKKGSFMFRRFVTGTGVSTALVLLSGCPGGSKAAGGGNAGGLVKLSATEVLAKASEKAGRRS